MKIGFVLLMSLVSVPAFGSVLYTVSDTQPLGRSLGYTILVDSFLQSDASGHLAFGPNQLNSCDTSGAPGFLCAGAVFRQTQGLNGMPVVYASMLLTDGTSGTGSNDAFTDTFVGASLTAFGSTMAFGGGSANLPAVFSVAAVADPMTAPEPSTWFAGFLGLGWTLWRLRNEEEPPNSTSFGARGRRYYRNRQSA